MNTTCRTLRVFYEIQAKDIPKGCSYEGLTEISKDFPLEGAPNSLSLEIIHKHQDPNTIVMDLFDENGRRIDRWIRERKESEGNTPSTSWKQEPVT